MKKILFLFLFVFLFIFNLSCDKVEDYCLIGAFLADQPTEGDIDVFHDTFGKKPYLVLIFLDWGKFPEKKIIESVYKKDCILFISWEPWMAEAKQAIDYEGLSSGKYDKYIKDFCLYLKEINKPCLLRFAHEMNGNWYPWSGIKIGRDNYVRMYRYVKDIFDESNCSNVKWVFSINWEDVPKENNYFLQYYPGDKYADYIGIDGYNWGNMQAWSRWMSFESIFSLRYEEIAKKADKPILISEFGSTSNGGDKRGWIREAMRTIKKMKKLKAFVIFNTDKEADWEIRKNSPAAEELKRQLKSNYFKDHGVF